MRIKTAICISFLFSFVLCNIDKAFCDVVNIPVETEELKIFLLKGYTEAKSVLNDVRIEYQTKSYKDNTLIREFLGTAFIKELKEKNIPVPEGSTTTKIKVEEYIKKNGNEIWILYPGDGVTTENISFSEESIRTKDSRFKVFDGQYVLDYHPTRNDGFTSVGRATLEESKTGLFEDSGTNNYGPIKFFGYHPDVMPDDVLKSPQVQIYPKPEIIDGLLTYKISASLLINKGNYDVIYWLSPERSCLPVRMELHNADHGLKNSMETKEFGKLDDGRWIIKSVLERNLSTKSGDTTPVEFGNETYTISKLEFNPQIDEKIFSTSVNDLPEGIQIIDTITGMRYFAGEGPVSDKRIADIMEE